jgi:hypothetical protein
MKPHEAAALLAVASGIDNRKPSAEAAESWAKTLKSLPLEDCREAVYDHYRESTDFLMPAHIVERVRKIRTARLADMGDVQPPAAIEAIQDPDEFDRAYRAWLLDIRNRVARGEALEPEHRKISENPPAEVKGYLDKLNREIDVSDRGLGAEATP